MPEYDGKMFDRIIVREVDQNPGVDLHIDHFEEVIRGEWPDYDKDPKDSRHYLRIRLSNKLANRGRISNPKYGFYSSPAIPDETTSLNWMDCWDEMKINAKIAIKDSKKFLCRAGRENRVTGITMKGKYESLEISIFDKEGGVKNTELTEEHLKNAITRLNTAGGRCRPSRYHARNAVMVGLIDRLEFDDEGFVIVRPIDLDDLVKVVESGKPQAGGVTRKESDWNVRSKRSIWNLDYEPTETDPKKRKKIMEERTDRHEDLVDFVIEKCLPEDADWKEGEYDLMVRKSGIELQFWEMKTIQEGDSADEKRQVLKALSQLKYYTFKNGGTKSYQIACFERSISEGMQKLLAGLDIHSCWRSGDSLIFSETKPEDNSWGLK